MHMHILPNHSSYSSSGVLQLSGLPVILATIFVIAHYA